MVARAVLGAFLESAGRKKALRYLLSLSQRTWALMTIVLCLGLIGFSSTLAVPLVLPVAAAFVLGLGVVYLYGPSAAMRKKGGHSPAVVSLYAGLFVWYTGAFAIVTAGTAALAMPLAFLISLALATAICLAFITARIGQQILTTTGKLSGVAFLGQHGYHYYKRLQGSRRQGTFTAARTGPTKAGHHVFGHARTTTIVEGSG